MDDDTIKIQSGININIKRTDGKMFNDLSLKDFYFTNILINYLFKQLCEIAIRFCNVLACFASII